MIASFIHWNVYRPIETENDVFLIPRAVKWYNTYIVISCNVWWVSSPTPRDPTGIFDGHKV